MALTSSCATRALWEDGRFARFREPATPAHLQLFQSRRGDDMLVRYDEVSDEDSGAQPRARAYWLAANHEPVKNPHQPKFVAVRNAVGLTAIPVRGFSATNAPLSNGLQAIASTNEHAFMIRFGEQHLGNYELPVYEEGSGKVKQVLLTPCAFAADLTVIGGFLFLWFWSAGGLTDVH